MVPVRRSWADPCSGRCCLPQEEQQQQQQQGRVDRFQYAAEGEGDDESSMGQLRPEIAAALAARQQQQVRSLWRWLCADDWDVHTSY